MKIYAWLMVSFFGWYPKPIDPWDERGGRSYIGFYYRKQIETLSKRFGYRSRFNLITQCAEIYNPHTSETLATLRAEGCHGCMSDAFITTFREVTPEDLTEAILGMFDPKKINIKHTIQ